MIDKEVMEIKKNIEDLVKDAFYTIYLKSEDTWYTVDSIELDMTTCEDDFDLPFFEITISWGNKKFKDEHYTKTISLDITKSREFLLGYIVANMEEAE